MRSIKRFLTVVTVAAITLVTFAAMVQGYRKGIDQTQQRLDQQLQVTARLLARMSTSKHRLSLGDSGIHYQRFNSDGGRVHIDTNIVIFRRILISNK